MELGNVDFSSCVFPNCREAALIGSNYCHRHRPVLTPPPGSGHDFSRPCILSCALVFVFAVGLAVGLLVTYVR